MLKDFNLIKFKEIESTNTYATELAKNGEKGKTVVIADSQTGGRGRKGKSFFSPKGGLYMSVILRPELTAEEALLITPAVACAVAKVLEKFSGKKMGIKWVNDIFCEGKKVCGILTEAKLDFLNNSLEYAVVGVGVNLFKPECSYPEEIKNIAGAVFEAEVGEDVKMKLAEKILEAINKEIQGIKIKQFLGEYKARSVLLGKQVTILSEPIQQGIATDIDEKARLIVKTENGVLTLDSGEISVKL